MLTPACFPSLRGYVMASRTDDRKQLSDEQWFLIEDLFPWEPPTRAGGRPPVPPRAVLEAIFNRESDFVRTPKYGIERKRQDWRKSSYRALKSFAPLVEVALAFYFSFLVIYCLVSGMWMSVPFMMLFQVGFFYVSWDSLRAAFSFRDSAPEVVSIQG